MRGKILGLLLEEKPQAVFTFKAVVHIRVPFNEGELS